MGIRVSDPAVTVYSDEKMLADVQAAIRSVTLTGQSYTLFGSRSVSAADLDALTRLERMYRKRVLMRRGYVPTLLPDFGGSVVSVGTAETGAADE